MADKKAQTDGQPEEGAEAKEDNLERVEVVLESEYPLRDPYHGTVFTPGTPAKAVVSSWLDAQIAAGLLKKTK